MKKGLDADNALRYAASRKEMAALAARLIDQARRRMARDSDLALQMQPLVDHLYSANSISSWALGRSSPPAEVLLAACKVSGLSIDDELFGTSQRDEMAALRDGLGGALRRLGELEAQRSRG